MNVREVIRCEPLYRGGHRRGHTSGAVTRRSKEENTIIEDTECTSRNNPDVDVDITNE